MDRKDQYLFITKTVFSISNIQVVKILFDSNQQCQYVSNCSHCQKTLKINGQNLKKKLKRVLYFQETNSLCASRVLLIPQRTYYLLSPRKRESVFLSGDGFKFQMRLFEIVTHSKDRSFAYSAFKLENYNKFNFKF